MFPEILKDLMNELIGYESQGYQVQLLSQSRPTSRRRRVSKRKMRRSTSFLRATAVPRSLSLALAGYIAITGFLGMAETLRISQHERYPGSLEGIVTELFEIGKRYILRHYDAEAPSRNWSRAPKINPLKAVKRQIGLA